MKKLLLLLCMFTGAQHCRAQYGSMMNRSHFDYRNTYQYQKDHGMNVISWLRSDLGYTFHYESLYYTARMAKFDPVTNAPVGDTSVRMKLQPKGFHPNFETGGFIPIMPANDNSNNVLAISYSILLGFTNYEYTRMGNIYPSSLLLMYVAAPVGLTFKTGCAAILDKSKRFTAGASAGVMPSFYVPDGDDGTTKFKLFPYVSGEVGFFLGICFKVRGTLGLGKETSLVKAGNDEASEIITTQPFTTLSVLIMPYSYDWDRNR